MSIIQRTRQVFRGAAVIGSTILLSSCYAGKELCPAYVQDPIPAGTYDYNAPYECSRWYETRYAYVWSSDNKQDALNLWADISGRPMYFEMQGQFRYSVKASDGYTYVLWGWGDTDQYYITLDRPRNEWDKVPV